MELIFLIFILIIVAYLGSDITFLKIDWENYYGVFWQIKRVSIN